MGALFSGVALVQEMTPHYSSLVKFIHARRNLVLRMVLDLWMLDLWKFINQYEFSFRTVNVHEDCLLSW